MKWPKKYSLSFMSPTTLIVTLFVAAFAVWSFWPQDSTALEVTMYKNRGCQCCSAWAKHLRKEGYNVQVRFAGNMDTIKKRYKVAAPYQSCHTALVNGYVIEGHVPMREIKRLLTERPDAIGISVPGMPTGSPGMEVPGEKADAYKVLLMKKDGTSSVYATY